MNIQFRISNSWITSSLVRACLLAAVLVPLAAAAPTSSVQVQMGSTAPLGRVLSLELTVNSVELVPAKGAAVTLVSRPFTLEQSHLAASAEAVSHADVPYGSYSKVMLTVSNPHIVFLDDFGATREIRWTGLSPVSVLLKQPVVTAATPSIVRISLDMASLMRFDPQHQSMLRGQPNFSVSQLFPNQVGASAEVAGELEPTVGRVVSVTATSFSVSDAVSGLTTVYLVDRNTSYNGVSLRTMTNLYVRIHASTRADGQLLAHEVSVSGSGSGSVVTGVITDATGNTLTAQELYGTGASAAALGSFAHVALDSSAAFEVDSKDMDLTALPFTFDSTSLVGGQRIQFISRTGMVSNAVIGASLPQAMTARLQLQTIYGVATNVGVAANGSTSFDLQLPSNDGSVLSNGTDMIHIVTQPLTKWSLRNVTEGAPVKVRGLLFYDASSDAGSARRESNSARRFIARIAHSNYYLVARSVQHDGGNHN